MTNPTPRPARRSVLKRINASVIEYQPLIQTAGILAGIVILCLTWWTASVSNRALILSLQQEANKQLPIWDFEVKDSLEIIRLKPFSPDIKIQFANAYFSKKVFDSLDWPLDPPSFELHLTVFKYDVGQLFRKNFAYSKDHFSILPRGGAPVLMEINYIQYGEARTVYGLFVIQYMIVDGRYEPKINLQGLIFIGYYDKQGGLEKLDEMTDTLIKALASQKRDSVKS
jgi:hypothetical protein